MKMATFKRNFTFPSNYHENIAKNIRKYRLMRHITQEQLAVDIERSYDFTRRLEFTKGKVHCSLDTLYRISIVLDVRIDKFFE